MKQFLAILFTSIATALGIGIYVFQYCILFKIRKITIKRHGYDFVIMNYFFFYKWWYRHNKIRVFLNEVGDPEIVKYNKKLENSFKLWYLVYLFALIGVIVFMALDYSW